MTREISPDPDLLSQVAAKIRDAFYEVRDNGGTMTEASEVAARELAPILGTEHLAGMQRAVREVNEANGWFEKDRSFGDGIALLHSEVSEALEAFRKWGLEDRTPYAEGDEPPGKPKGVGSEYADVLIRLLDSCEREGIDLQAEFDRKLAYNRKRSHRHGGKRL